LRSLRSKGRAPRQRRSLPRSTSGEAMGSHTRELNHSASPATEITVTFVRLVAPFPHSRCKGEADDDYPHRFLRGPAGQPAPRRCASPASNLPKAKHSCPSCSRTPRHPTTPSTSGGRQGTSSFGTTRPPGTSPSTTTTDPAPTARSSEVDPEGRFSLITVTAWGRSSATAMQSR
jgi:hypothetical protein